MNIRSFEDLLIAAALQLTPQRLLLAFAIAEPEPAPAPGTPPRSTLVPVMCVDKQVGELDTFGNLTEEARRTGQAWDVLLVSSLSGQPGRLATPQQTDAALDSMVQAIRHGQMDGMLAFDRDGELLRRA